MKTPGPRIMRTVSACQNVISPIRKCTDFPRGTTGRKGDDFWQFNAQFGRFARNRCEVSAGILNLADTNYRLDPINYLDTLPRSRTAVLRCKITF